MARDGTVRLLALLMFLTFVGALGYIGYTSSLFSATERGGGGQPAGAGVFTPQSGYTDVSFTTISAYNDTGSEEFDNTCNFYTLIGGKESYYTQITDTSSPTASDIPSNYEYVIRCVSTDADSGDTGFFTEVKEGDAETIDNGRGVKFTAQGAGMSIVVLSPQHGTLQFAAVDRKVGGGTAVYDTSDIDADDFETTGVQFTGTTNNATNKTVGAGGVIDYDILIQNVESAGDTSAGVHGLVVFVDAASTVWQKPTLYYNGKELSDYTRDPKEILLWDGWEYAFKIDDSVIRNPRTSTVDRSLRLFIQALSSVDPGTADFIRLGFASVGAYQDITGKGVLYSTSNNAPSPTIVYTNQIVQIGVA